MEKPASYFMTVCSLHFAPDSYFHGTCKNLYLHVSAVRFVLHNSAIVAAKKRIDLKKGVVPMFSLPKSSHSSPEKDKDRELRTIAPMKRKETVCKVVYDIIVLVTYNSLFTVIILGVKV